MTEAGAGLTSRQRIADKLGPNDRGLAIFVPFFSLLDITHTLTETLGFTVYEAHGKRPLKLYMQSVDLMELKHHPILVAVSGFGTKGNLLRTDCGEIDIKEDIMAPLFPPIATRLADNPKIFLFIVRSSSFERHALHFVEAIWENCIVGYIPYDDVQRVAHVVYNELASPSMSVQEIFTLIHRKLPFCVMTVIDRLKEPVYLHPRRSELMETHSRSQGIVTCL